MKKYQIRARETIAEARLCVRVIEAEYESGVRNSLKILSAISIMSGIWARFRRFGIARSQVKVKDNELSITRMREQLNASVRPGAPN